MTGTIKNSVGHTEFNELKTDVIANGKTVYKDVSNTIPTYHGNVQRLSNACYVHRFGNMCALSVCFNIANDGVPSGAFVFGFPQGYQPSANAFCLFASSAGYCVPLHLTLSDGVYKTEANGAIPAGLYRGVMTYVINATEET